MSTQFETNSPPMEMIAEIGSNYGGELDEARDYIRRAAAAGATAVKFQTLRRDKLVAPRVRVDGQWVANPVYQNIKNLELPDDWHATLLTEAKQLGVEFFSTPFHLEAVDLLESIGVSTYKIASGDLTFLPLLERVGSTGKRVIFSTGGSTLEEVRTALEVLRKAGARDITMLHCVVSYPPAWEEANLNAITTLKTEFGVPVGLSDHTPGSLLAIAARALGACVIEKHVTKDRALPGPDHPYAMTFDEFSRMVADVRTLETALGSGEKRPSESEAQRKHRFRRGIYDPETFLPSKDGTGIWLRPVPPV